MEHDDKDVSKTIEQASIELHKLTILAESKRIKDFETKVHGDFSYMTTYFQQAQKHLT